MSQVLMRVVALGATAAERGGGYCALCFATSADRRLVSPRHLQRLVQQLAGYMTHLAPVASSLTWGARACAWCESRCAAACRVMRALAAAARAHALLGRLDAGQEASRLKKQMAEVEEALGRTRDAALRCTDVLLIDTLQPVMELVQSTAPASSAQQPPAAKEIETVVIEDDPADPLAPAPPAPPAPPAREARKARRPSPVVPEAPLRQIAPTCTPDKVTPGTNVATAPAQQVTQSGKPESAAACNPLRMPALCNVAPGQSAAAAAAAGASPALVPAAPAQASAVSVAAGDAVLMVLPPGAQIVSRLDGVGPKYLLLNPPDPIPPPAPAPAPAPSPPLAALAGLSAPPGSCTVSCESDSDSSDSILLSQLLKRRDEFNQKQKNNKSDQNNTQTNNNTNNSFDFYNTGNKCYITDVKSLSEKKSDSAIERNKQCFITEVKSLCSVQGSNKRNSDVTRQCKKAKSDSYKEEEEEARAAVPSTDRVDWEDKIPMDVISFMDATDPCANSFLPPKAAQRLLNHALSGAHAANTTNSGAQAQSAQPPSAQDAAPKVRSYALDSGEAAAEGPRPLALISNVTSATGEKSVVIDLC